MKAIDLANVQEATEFENVIPGGYTCKITAAEDVPEKEYLKIEYDITQGKFKDYYRDLCVRCNFWGARFIKSYKEKALPFFKGFTTAVENSNPSYKWNNDETTLVGKFVGLVLGEEEYEGNDGTIKTRLYVAQVRSIKEIQSGNFKVPDKKILKESTDTMAMPGTGFIPTTNDDLPF